MKKKVYHPDAAHHCATVTVAVACVVKGIWTELGQKVKTLPAETFQERAAKAQRKLQEKAIKLQSK
jgi:hypothetical protein